MQLRNARFAIFLMTLFGVALGGLGCGKEAKAAKPNSRSVSSAFAETALTGNWLENACDEGDSGPDMPPPPYLKGIVKFGDHVVRLSSRVFDDKDCTAQRTGTVAETTVPYVLAEHTETTDGSVAINLQFPETDTTYGFTMYGLAKIENGILKLAFFRNEESRPKSMERIQAQIFSPM